MISRYNCRSTIHGITLIEVMVAFVILALAVTVLLRIFSSGLSNTVLSRQYSDAVMMAQSQLAQIGSVNEIVPGVESGMIDDKFAWKTTIDPYFPWIANDQATMPVSAFTVDVEISWLEKGQPRNVTLRSIKLQQNDVVGGRR